MSDAATTAFQIRDRYVGGPPSVQNAVDIFGDSWVSGLPSPARSGGKLPLFADKRMRWFLERLQIDLSKAAFAELGPFEGGHSYMLHKAGAGSILAVEANTLSYLKTLVVKETYGLDRLRVVCGEIEAWLTDYSTSFDVILASGVLYHFKRPLLALYNMSQHAEAICLWTHYVDPEACSLDDPRMAPLTGTIERDNVRGVEIDGYARSYHGAEGNADFCGGVGAESVWLKRADIVDALTEWGFEVEVGLEEPDHPNGPCAAFFARHHIRQEAP